MTSPTLAMSPVLLQDAFERSRLGRGQFDRRLLALERHHVFVLVDRLAFGL